MKSLACFAILVTCTVALAQPKPTPAPAANDPAKVHVDQGAALYNDHNFSAALAEFEAAYAIKPAPYILNNIGLTQKALFRYTEAIASLQRFLAESIALTQEVRAQTLQIIAEMQALLAPITLDIAPVGAAITLDARPLGAAPLAAPVQIAAGSHTIEIAADGYTPQKRDIMVTAGVAITIKVALAAIPKTGKVHVVASVPQATILIDGHPIGMSDITAELDPGGHTIEVSASGFDRHREELMLAAGQMREIAIKLDASGHAKPWYKQWYVLPIAIVVVGTITGITIDLTTRQGPIDGTLGTGKQQ